MKDILNFKIKDPLEQLLKFKLKFNKVDYYEIKKEDRQYLLLILNNLIDKDENYKYLKNSFYWGLKNKYFSVYEEVDVLLFKNILKNKKDLFFENKKNKYSESILNYFKLSDFNNDLLNFYVDELLVFSPRKINKFFNYLLYSSNLTANEQFNILSKVIARTSEKDMVKLKEYNYSFDVAFFINVVLDNSIKEDEQRKLISKFMKSSFFNAEKININAFYFCLIGKLSFNGSNAIKIAKEKMRVFEQESVNYLKENPKFAMFFLQGIQSLKSEEHADWEIKIQNIILNRDIQLNFSTKKQIKI